MLVTVDGYWYNGKALPIQDKVAAIAAALPTLERVVVVPYLQQTPGASDDLSAIRGGVSLEAFIAPHAPGPVEYRRLPFDHPLYILYSSGTTGEPRCIVHGAGGSCCSTSRTTCDRRREARRPDLYFTTCGWMMWDWLLSGLATGATLLLYDGSLFAMRGRRCGIRRPRADDPLRHVGQVYIGRG